MEIACFFYLVVVVLSGFRFWSYSPLFHEHTHTHTYLLMTIILTYPLPLGVDKSEPTVPEGMHFSHSYLVEGRRGKKADSWSVFFCGAFLIPKIDNDASRQEASPPPLIAYKGGLGARLDLHVGEKKRDSQMFFASNHPTLIIYARFLCTNSHIFFLFSKALFANTTNFFLSSKLFLFSTFKNCPSF